jgi:anhydro-N-acetylmuramic acid kinase
MRQFTNGQQSMDRDGLWAAGGQVNAYLLARWLEHPFFAQTPPKSTGREMFGEKFFRPALQEIQQLHLSGPDAVATFTELTAQSIAANYRLHLPSMPQTVILAGGGAVNPVLAKRIEACLRELSPDIHVVGSQEFSWRPQSIEAAAFAYLAYLRFHRQPSNLPETTGARRAISLGQLTEP